MRILYVEDNETNQALVGRVMRARQHEVVFCEEGEDALEILANDPKINLILLDIELAGTFTGIEVIEALRARNDTRPVVAVTAYAMMGDRERILAAGCDQYLPKPLVVPDLLSLLDEYEDTGTVAPAAIEAPPAKVASGDGKPAEAVPGDDGTPAAPKPEAAPAKRDPSLAEAPAADAAPSDDGTPAAPKPEAAPAKRDPSLAEAPAADAAPSDDDTPADAPKPEAAPAKRDPSPAEAPAADATPSDDDTPAAPKPEAAPAKRDPSPAEAPAADAAPSDDGTPADAPAPEQSGDGTKPTSPPVSVKKRTNSAEDDTS